MENGCSMRSVTNVNAVLVPIVYAFVMHTNFILRVLSSWIHGVLLSQFIDAFEGSSQNRLFLVQIFFCF